MARLGDERLDRLARFGVDDLAEYLDQLRRRRRLIVLRADRRLRLGSRGPETGQDEGPRRGAPDPGSHERRALIRHGQPPPQGIRKHSYAAWHSVALKRSKPAAMPGRIDQLCRRTRTQVSRRPFNYGPTPVAISRKPQKNQSDRHPRGATCLLRSDRPKQPGINRLRCRRTEAGWPLVILRPSRVRRYCKPMVIIAIVIWQ